MPGGFDSVGKLDELLKQVAKAREADGDAAEQESVVVCGSIFLLAELFPKLGLHPGTIWKGDFPE